MCFARSEKGLQAICSLITTNPAAGPLPIIFDKTWRAGEGSEDGKATSASLFPMDDGDPSITAGQTELLWRKSTSKERESAKTCAEQQEGLAWVLNIMLGTDKADILVFYEKELVTSSFTNQQRNSLGA